MSSHPALWGVLDAVSLHISEGWSSTQLPPSASSSFLLCRELHVHSNTDSTKVASRVLEAVLAAVLGTAGTLGALPSLAQDGCPGVRAAGRDCQQAVGSAPPGRGSRKHAHGFWGEASDTRCAPLPCFPPRSSNVGRKPGPAAQRAAARVSNEFSRAVSLCSMNEKISFDCA